MCAAPCTRRGGGPLTDGGLPLRVAVAIELTPSRPMFADVKGGHVDVAPETENGHRPHFYSLIFRCIARKHLMATTLKMWLKPTETRR